VYITIITARSTMGRAVTVEQLGAGSYSVALGGDAAPTVAALKTAIRQRTNIPEGLQALSSDAAGGSVLADTAAPPDVVYLAVNLRGGCDLGVGTPCGGLDVCCSVQ